MDQQQLRKFENRCVQEEQPFCTAACPIHVDVRSFMSSLAKGDLRGARRVLDRTMPFPEIVGRLCEGPCSDYCKRAEIDDPLAITSLEHYCVSRTNTVVKLPKLPDKGGKVAVIGGGLSAMTAALDLGRKGRQTTIFTSRASLGGTLNDYNEKLLPQKTLKEATTLLESYEVSLQYDVILDASAIEPLIEKYHAVYFDLDEIDPGQLPFDFQQPDEITLALPKDGCFGGGGQKPKQNASNSFCIITQVEDGRRAALTIERYLQKVSLTAERGLEGTRETRLYTSITGIPRTPVVTAAAPAAGYSDEEAKAEAGRCILCQCMECVKQCVYLQEYKEYPKSLVRKIYNNQSIVQGTRAANKMINSCSLCEQCSTICPNDFPVADICRTTRQEMVDNTLMPPSAHDFALEDMQFSLSDFCSLIRHQPGHSSSRYLFYPGCQLAGSAPGTVKATYRFLSEQLAGEEGGVALMLSCCGIPAHWAGQQKLFQETINRFKQEIDRLGNPTVITACSSCLSIFKEFATEIEVTSLWQQLDTLELPGNSRGAGQQLTIHDPCTARDQKDMRGAIRSICNKLGLEIIENDFAGELADCCGYGGLMQFGNQKLGEKAASHKASRSPSNSSGGLAYCAMCRDNLAAAGSPVAHLLDYIFPGGEGSQNPLERENPGFSNRHENRARLKEQLLTELWEESPTQEQPHQGIKVSISLELQDLLNRRHILLADIQKVILNAEKSGIHLFNPDTNHRLACYKPVRVTYWVEYIASENGYTVFNAYSHRMNLPEELS